MKNDISNKIAVDIVWNLTQIPRPIARFLQITYIRDESSAKFPVIYVQYCVMYGWIGVGYEKTNANP